MSGPNGLSLAACVSNNRVTWTWRHPAGQVRRRDRRQRLGKILPGLRHHAEGERRAIDLSPPTRASSWNGWISRTPSSSKGSAGPRHPAEELGKDLVHRRHRHRDHVLPLRPLRPDRRPSTAESAAGAYRRDTVDGVVYFVLPAGTSPPQVSPGRLEGDRRAEKEGFWISKVDVVDLEQAGPAKKGPFRGLVDRLTPAPRSGSVWRIPRGPQKGRAGHGPGRERPEFPRPSDKLSARNAASPTRTLFLNLFVEQPPGRLAPVRHELRLYGRRRRGQDRPRPGTVAGEGGPSSVGPSPSRAASSAQMLAEARRGIPYERLPLTSSRSGPGRFILDGGDGQPRGVRGSSQPLQSRSTRSKSGVPRRDRKYVALPLLRKDAAQVPRPWACASEEWDWRFVRDSPL